MSDGFSIEGDCINPGGSKRSIGISDSPSPETIIEDAFRMTKTEGF